MRPLAAIALLLLLAGCAPKRVPAGAAIAPLPPNDREYVDLSAGWRLRIVAAVTKSGKHEVEFTPVKQEGNVITLKLSDDFIGYETAFWSILARPGGGISLQLASAELTVNGNPGPLAKPTRALIHAPPSARFIRMFYLTRKSDADHNMAIAGAAKRDRLEAFTRAFHDSPADACADFAKQREYCEWVPAGVAVRPEVPKIVDGVARWPVQ